MSDKYNDTLAIKDRESVLLEPAFRYSTRDGQAYKPMIQETLKEWLSAMNFVTKPAYSITALNLLFQLSMLVPFVLFCYAFLSLSTVVLHLILIFVLGTIYNTIWYHRYCSHRSFEFAHPLYGKVFLWTNPIAFIFREESYAIPHRIHHGWAEKPGDPYGPHLGWLASFLAPEITQRMNTNLSRVQYESLVRSINHIGHHADSYDRFKTTSCIENLYYYAARTISSQSLWIGSFFLAGGTAYVITYFSAIFIATVIIRDFNWRSHGGNHIRPKKLGWEFDLKSYALNQRFYGYIAAEWHDNHHKYPFSANNGFLPGQIDLAFQIIKLMHRIGIIRSYVDAKPLFEKECLGFSSANQASIMAR